METEFEIIDAHVHLYRSMDLEKKNVVNPGRRDRDRWGNPDSVTGFMDQQGISRILCLPNFPTLQLRQALRSRIDPGLPEQERGEALEAVEDELRAKLRRQNEWLAEVARALPRLAAAIAIQKIFSPEEMVKEVRLRVEQGAKAVKLLPGMYHEYPDDRSFWPMYETCQELGLPVVSDTGTLGGSETGTCYGMPDNFVDVLQDFPRLRLVMAHFPSAFWDQRLLLAKRFPNLHFDISGSFYASHLEVRDGHRALAVEDAVRVMREIGIERFMFGTDGPRFLFNPALEQVLSLELTDEEKRLLLAGNARRVYAL